jgi:hypothetical protein
MEALMEYFLYYSLLILGEKVWAERKLLLNPPQIPLPPHKLAGEDGLDGPPFPALFFL